mgnify:CR=1 FL=1
MKNIKYALFIMTNNNKNNIIIIIIIIRPIIIKPKILLISYNHQFSNAAKWMLKTMKLIEHVESILFHNHF